MRAAIATFLQGVLLLVTAKMEYSKRHAHDGVGALAHGDPVGLSMAPVHDPGMVELHAAVNDPAHGAKKQVGTTHLHHARSPMHDARCVCARLMLVLAGMLVHLVNNAIGGVSC